MSVMRGCSIHGKNVGLHGDKTSSGGTMYRVPARYVGYGVTKTLYRRQDYSLSEVWGGGCHYGRRSPLFK